MGYIRWNLFHHVQQEIRADNAYYQSSRYQFKSLAGLLYPLSCKARFGHAPCLLGEFKTEYALHRALSLKFFVPNIQCSEQAEKQYLTAKRSVEYHFGTVMRIRLRSIKFHQNGQTMRAIVGEREPSKGVEVVIAIFELVKKNFYLVCTPTRGFLHGLPHFVAKADVRQVEEFD